MFSLEWWLHFLMTSYAGFVIMYFIAINIVYLVMFFGSFSQILLYLRRNQYADYKAILQSEFTVPISILAPAYNEEATIVESVNSLMRLDYSTVEVIVINDGSKDSTLAVLVAEFDLRMSQRVYVPALAAKPVRGIYVSRKPEWKTLVVVDKENGGKADALNVGINVAQYPLFCAIDADSILENDALLKVSKPYLEDRNVIAVGGIVRIANGCTVERGRVTEVRLANKPLPVFQTVEYFRAFLSGRMAWNRVNGLMIISGAFGLFRKDIVVAVGGYKHDTVGEDMELVTRMHRYMMDRKEPYRVVFVPDPVCWTEAPESLRILGRQRNRWHRGLLDTILIHREMLFRPKYKAIGMLAMPYFTLFELLGPVVEALGYLVIPISAWQGTLDPEIFFIFLFVAIVYGMLFSVGAVLLEEVSFHRYPRPSDLLRLMLYAVIENFGYRQITVWWRLRSFWDYWRGVKSWGTMQRAGFGKSGAQAPASGKGAQP